MRWLAGGWHAALAGAAALGWAVLPVAYVAHATPPHGAMTGGVSLYPADQLQDLAWVRDFSGSPLASDHFMVPASHAVFVDPLFALSGLLVRAGVDVRWGEILWQPVAALVLVAGVVLYCRRTAPRGRWGQAAAVFLALLAMNPLVALGHWTGLTARLGVGALDDMGGEMVSVGGLWGYAPAAIAVGLMPLVFLLVERAVSGPPRLRVGATAAACALGLLAAWVHPWQGAVTVLVLCGLLAWDRRRVAATVVPVVAATAAPIAYYAALPHIDAAWRVASSANDAALWDARIVVLGLLPLGALAIVGARRTGPLDVQDHILRLWPLATLATYLLHPTFSNHVVEGLSIPLAVLAVHGWRRITAGRTGTAGLLAATAGFVAVGVMLVPGSVENVRSLTAAVDGGQQAYYLRPGEAQALAWIAHRPRGAVLAGSRLAPAVPAMTGDDVWSGHPSWTPDFSRRSRLDDDLLAGRLAPGAATDYVRGTRVRYVWADCEHTADLRVVLGTEVVETARFGCSSVYEVAPGPTTHR